MERDRLPAHAPEGWAGGQGASSLDNRPTISCLLDDPLDEPHPEAAQQPFPTAPTFLHSSSGLASSLAVQEGLPPAVGGGGGEAVGDRRGGNQSRCSQGHAGEQAGGPDATAAALCCKSAAAAAPPLAQAQSPLRPARAPVLLPASASARRCAMVRSRANSVVIGACARDECSPAVRSSPEDASACAQRWGLGG